MGQPSDRGLFFPEKIPQLAPTFLRGIHHYAKEQIALEVIRPYVGDAIPANELIQIVTETVAFPFPLVPVTQSISTLELFHGPTLAFKDVGARFMSRCLAYFTRNNNNKITVLVATSGDTGGAVAAGFHGVEGIDVMIVYPSGKVSPVQEAQLTTWGGNVRVVEVDGDFDDCQRMVKDAFATKEVSKKMTLTSANSINVARWLPQQFYYFYAWQQWSNKTKPPVISVPSGNFGNLCAGLLARASGLPVKKFIAACNANDTVPRFLQTGSLQPAATVATLSNAMDVSAPSNLTRILQLFRERGESLNDVVTSYSITDDETSRAIKEVCESTRYLMDPHGAVGYCALERYRQTVSANEGYFLETAHPVKFGSAVEKITGKAVDMPPLMKELSSKGETVKMAAASQDLIGYLLGT